MTKGIKQNKFAKCSNCAENCTLRTSENFRQKRRAQTWIEKEKRNKTQDQEQLKKLEILTEKGFKAYDHLAVDFALSVGASEKEK